MHYTLLTHNIIDRVVHTKCKSERARRRQWAVPTCPVSARSMHCTTATEGPRGLTAETQPPGAATAAFSLFSVSSSAKPAQNSASEKDEQRAQNCAKGAERQILARHAQPRGRPQGALELLAQALCSWHSFANAVRAKMIKRVTDTSKLFFSSISQARGSYKREGECARAPIAAGAVQQGRRGKNAGGRCFAERKALTRARAGRSCWAQGGRVRDRHVWNDSALQFRRALAIAPFSKGRRRARPGCGPGGLCHVRLRSTCLCP
jgi:hypothetical protein